MIIKSASLYQVTMSSYAISMESQEPLVSIKFCFITLPFFTRLPLLSLVYHYIRPDNCSKSIMATGHCENI